MDHSLVNYRDEHAELAGSEGAFRAHSLAGLSTRVNKGCLHPPQCQRHLGWRSHHRGIATRSVSSSGTHIFTHTQIHALTHTHIHTQAW
jgi:hypothetical protein